MDRSMSRNELALQAKIATALTRIEARVPTTGPSAGLINAESMANAVIDLCGPILREPVLAILTDLIAELREHVDLLDGLGYQNLWDAQRDARDIADRAEARLRQITEEDA